MCDIYNFHVDHAILAGSYKVHMMAYSWFHVNSMILLNLSVSYANFFMNHMLAQLRYVSYATKVGCVV